MFLLAKCELSMVSTELLQQVGTLLAGEDVLLGVLPSAGFLRC